MFEQLDNAEYQVKTYYFMSQSHKGLENLDSARLVLKKAIAFNVHPEHCQKELDELEALNTPVKKELTEAEKLAEKYDIDVERVEEGFKIKQMIMDMPKAIKKGSKWVVLPMSWVKQWQNYIYFDLVMGNESETSIDKDAEMPEEVDWTEICKPIVAKHNLQDNHKDFKWQNLELREGLQENEDFFLVTPELLKFAEDTYGIKGQPVFRYGIEQADGETVVELYLKRFVVYPVPNKPFNFGAVPKNVLVSRVAPIKELKAKLLRILNMAAYSAGNKQVTYQKCRLWKHDNNNMDQIAELEKRQKNYTQMDFEGTRCDEDEEDETVDEMSIAPEDIIVIEMPKDKSWVFKAKETQTQDTDLESTSVESQAEPGQGSRASLSYLANKDVNTLLLPKSRKGAVGLSNLGNTCFMNSGLQCLSNTPELCKYFLMGIHKKEINLDNPLGMGGRLAKAYGGLVAEMWQGTDSRVTPHDLKRTLGSKISRFQGYGQQDSAELTNYILDLLHEDLNRITKKPYIEMQDKPNRPDKEIADEFYANFLARNQSIIVDLMYGQLKSTVTCTECKNPQLTFDPQLAIVLPIARQVTMEIYYLPYKRFDEDKGKSTCMNQLKSSPKPSWKFSDLKEDLMKKLQFKEANRTLVFASVKNGRVSQIWKDQD